MWSNNNSSSTRRGCTGNKSVIVASEEGARRDEWGGLRASKRRQAEVQAQIVPLSPGRPDVLRRRPPFGLAARRRRRAARQEPGPVDAARRRRARAAAERDGRGEAGERAVALGFRARAAALGRRRRGGLGDGLEGPARRGELDVAVLGELAGRVRVVAGLRRPAAAWRRRARPSGVGRGP